MVERSDSYKIIEFEIFQTEKAAMEGYNRMKEIYTTNVEPMYLRLYLYRPLLGRRDRHNGWEHIMFENIGIEKEDDMYFKI